MTLHSHAALAFVALACEAAAGYPDALVLRIGHPVTWIGALIAALDRGLNRENWLASRRRLAGVAALGALLAVSLGAGFALQRALLALPFGLLLAALSASTLLAQRSLHRHVAEVAAALDLSLEDGRRAVARIVGRDASALDHAGVARAAIESLAENFSDGVVAPALWLAAGGLPGALAYKAVNTADSMIGHRTPRHEAFGWASARFDDLVNLPASRLAALLIAGAAAILPGASAARAWRSMRRDAWRHDSPNAGWPEAAMAGALGLALGGPRSYGAVAVDGAWLGDGARAASVGDIWRALALYRLATAGLWLVFLAAMAAIT